MNYSMDYTDGPCQPINDSMFINETAGMEESILETLYLPIVVCCGMIGILLTVIVLSRKSMCTSTNCYLTGLAVADMLFLLTLSILILLEKKYTPIGVWWVLSHDYLAIFLHSFHIASIWITVMLAVERYIAICHPLRAMSICTVKRARIIIIFLFFSAFICRVPNFFSLAFASDCRGWTVHHVMAYNDFVYSWIIEGCLTVIFPFLALLVLNVRLIVEIRRSSRYLRYHLAADSSINSVISSEQLKITLMLISIVVAFFLYQSPFAIWNAYATLKRHHSDIFIENQWFPHLSKILVALKSSCNFVLYCWFSEKFWNTFKRVFCNRHCLPKQLPKGNRASSQNNAHRPSYMVTRETTC